MTNPNANKWLINFYKSQIIRVNKKIANLLDQKNEFIELESELINVNKYIDFLKSEIKKDEQTIKELEDEIQI